MSIVPSNDDSVSTKRRKALAKLLRKMGRRSWTMTSPPYSLVEVLEKRKRDCANQTGSENADEKRGNDLGENINHHHASLSE